MDDAGPSELPLRAPKRRPKSRIKVSTLKRLSTIPPHKVRHDNRHFPTGVLIGGGSNNRSVFQELLKGNAEPKRPSSADTDGDGDRSSESANERRKRFLTMSNLKRVFRALDLSDDGYIDVDELFEAIKKIRGSLTHAEIADVVWEVDDDRDGKLSMQDYLSTYRRSQADESGFEPKRFFAIVEFLLMDRDLSGEVSLDEAMTTIFERQGADNLADVTKDFFRMAGMAEGDTDPPPGASITFDAYYQKVGCAKPRVPSTTDVAHSFASRRRLDEGRGVAPKLVASASEGMLPRLLNPLPRTPAFKAAFSPSQGPFYFSPTKVPASRGNLSPMRGGGSAPASGFSVLSRTTSSHTSRPATVGATGAGSLSASIVSSLKGGGAAGGASSSHGGSPNGAHSPITRSKSRADTLINLARNESGGLMPLQPITRTGELATSALSKVGHSSRSIELVKNKAASALKIRDEARNPIGNNGGGSSHALQLGSATSGASGRKSLSRPDIA